jgi:hypothetical protein
VRGFPQAFDVAEELHLDRRLPARPDAKLAPESFLVGWLIAENAGPNIVSEDLRRLPFHGRSLMPVACASVRECPSSSHD